MERHVARTQILHATWPQLLISPEVQARLNAAPNAELCTYVSAALTIVEQRPTDPATTPQLGPLQRRHQQLAHSRTTATAALFEAQQRLDEAKGITNWAVRRQLQADVAVHRQALDRITTYQHDLDALATDARTLEHQRVQWEITHGPALACGWFALIELDQREAEALLELQSHPPAYLAELGPPSPTSRWQEATLRVERYRSANDITDPDHALGPEPADPTAHWELQHLATELTHLRTVLSDQRGLPPPTATTTRGHLVLDDLEGPAPFSHP